MSGAVVPGEGVLFGRCDVVERSTKGGYMVSVGYRYALKATKLAFKGSSRR